MEENKPQKSPRRKLRNPRALRAQRVKKGKQQSPRANKRNRELMGMLRIALLLIVGAVALVAIVLSMRPSVQYLNEPEIQRIQRMGVLRVGVLTDAAGFSAGGEGLEVALARALSRRIFPELDPDSSLELVPVNDYTAIPKISNESADIAIARQWAASPGLYAYSAPYFVDTVRLLCLPGNENRPLAAEQTVGVIGGSAARKAWEDYNLETEQGLTAEDYASYQDMCMALLNGNVQYIALPASHLPQVSQWGFALHRQALGAAEYVAVAGLDKSALAGLMDLIIDEMKRSGELDALVRQYGLEQYRAW